MLITIDWLKEHYACTDGKHWFDNFAVTGTDHTDLYNLLMEEERHDWACWLLAKLGDVEFAIRCVLKLYREPEYVKWAEAWLSDEDRTLYAAVTMWRKLAPNRDRIHRAAEKSVEAAASSSTRSHDCVEAALFKIMQHDVHFSFLPILNECEAMKKP